EQVDVIAAKALDVCVCHHGSRIVADHNIPVPRTGPLGKKSALFIGIDQPFLHLDAHGWINEVQQRKQASERIPESGIGKHVAGVYATVIGAVMDDLAVAVDFVESTGKEYRTV